MPGDWRTALKQWNLIGNYLQETDSEHPHCPRCCLEIQLWPKLDSLYWAVCPDLPPPFPPYTNIFDRASSDTSGVCDWAACTVSVPWVWASPVLALWQRCKPLLEIRMRSQCAECPSPGTQCTSGLLPYDVKLSQFLQLG